MPPDTFRAGHRFHLRPATDRGDGRLPHPGAEQIVEVYCDAAARSWAHLSLDYQWVKNPGYNTDRGPVSIVAVRAHAQF